jgi:translocation protein SEC63
LVVYPQKVINLTPDSPQTIKLGFQAPNQTGLFPINVYVKSDAWVGCDIIKEFRLKVEPPIVREEVDDEISDAEEDSIAGLMQQQRAGGGKAKDDDLTDSSDDESGTESDSE